MSNALYPPCPLSFSSTSALTVCLIPCSLMKYGAQFLPKYRFLRLLRPAVAEVGEPRGSSDVAWHCRRLLGTAAAAPEMPPADQRERKRVSREERKAMVVAYVDKHRMLNEGKFPTANDIQKQVGGSYYVVRSILQELQYNTKLPTAVRTDKTSIVGIGISDLSEAVDSDVPQHVAIVTNDRRISAEDGSEGQNGISEVREVSNTEAPTRTTAGSTLQESEFISKISSVAATNKTSVVRQTTEVIGISEIREVPDSEVPGMATVANNCRISTEKESSSPIDLVENKIKRIIPTVATTGRNPVAGQTDKYGVREVSDNDAQLGTNTMSNEYGMSTEDGSTSQGEVGYSCQSVVGLSIDTMSNDVTAEDSATSEISVDLKLQRDNERMSTADVDGNNSRFVDCTEVLETKNLEKVMVHEAVKATTMVSKFSSKSGHPSECLSSGRSEKLAETDEVSSPASESDQFTRDGVQNTQAESSLWDNLKSLATSFLSIWRKT